MKKAGETGFRRDTEAMPFNNTHRSVPSDISLETMERVCFSPLKAGHGHGQCCRRKRNMGTTGSLN